MSSPIELLRTTVLSFLSREADGLNIEFATQCASRNIPLPIPGIDGAVPDVPFIFTGESPNVFTARADIDWLERETQLQYPALILYGGGAVPSYQDRIVDVQFQGDVSVEILAYLAWFYQQPPTNHDYETPLDALEAAFYSVLNRLSNPWPNGVLYRGNVAVRERMKLSLVSENQLLRCGLRLSVTARCIL